MFSLLENC